MQIVALGLRGFPDVQGGIEKHCEQLYPRLVQLGCEIIVFSRSPYTGNNPSTFKGVKIIPVWTPRNKLLETVLHTFFCTLIANKFNPDIIHYHAAGPAMFVPLAKMFGLRVVATHHGFDYSRAKWGTFAKAFLRQGERHLCQSHGVITVSRHIQTSLLHRLGCQSELIPNGVELPEILPAGEVCRKYAVQKKRYFLFTGRFVPEKNIDKLILAFSAARTNWKLVIAGSADHEDNYSRNLMKMIRVTPGVISTGFIKGAELQEIYSNAGCFVLPSSHEGLPISLLEALSYGLPCIVSDIPANRNVGYSGIHFFPSGDIEALTSLLIPQALITEPTGIDKAARVFVARNYNWDDIAQSTMILYKKILNL
jgi:glycosyltransferase involved in cell wall biosynthesis